MSLIHRKENDYQEPSITVMPATKVVLTAKNSANEARTNQSFKKTCDINCILARYRKTGVLDHVTKYEPQYGVISGMDFEEAFKTVEEATKMFKELPAEIRANFHHKPENFLAFMEEEQNRNVERLLSTSSSREGTAEGATAPETSEAQKEPQTAS